MTDAAGDTRAGVRADVLVEGARIAAIGPELAASDAEVVDASGGIVMPGFVDAHRHVWQTQLRTVAADWSLFDYFVQMRLVYASFYTAEDEVGKEADVIVLRTDGIRMTPASDAVAAAVLYATPADVETVLVAGRPVKRAGRLVGVDWPALSARLARSRSRIDAGFRSVDVGAIEQAAAAFFPRLA